MPADDYLAREAVHISKRSTCDRLHVGAVFYKDGHFLGRGYNHLPGNKSCDVDGHVMNETGGCIGTIHAEMDALVNVIFAGNAHYIFKSELFITHMPCYYCAKLLVKLKIQSVTYIHYYASKGSYGSGRDLLRQNGIPVIKWHNV